MLPEGGDPFWIEVEDDYREVFPDDDAGPPPAPEDVAGMSEEIDASGRFAAAAVRRYVWDVTYSAEEYIGVLETYSGHRATERRAPGAALRADPQPHRRPAGTRGEEVVPRAAERGAAALDAGGDGRRLRRRGVSA